MRDWKKKILHISKQILTETVDTLFAIVFTLEKIQNNIKKMAVLEVNNELGGLAVKFGKNNAIL